MSGTPGPCVRRAAGFVARRIAGELVVVPVLRSEAASGVSLPFFVLNESAETLWESLAEPRSPDELVRLLTQAWDVSADRAREDVTTFLAELRVLGAVEDTICPGT
jgi:hypothetical protein